MAGSGFKTKLRGFNKRWKNTREEVGDRTGGFETIAGGNYVLGNLKLEFTEGSTGLGIARRCEVMEGDLEGHKVSDVQWLESNDRSLEFAMQFMNFLGETDIDDLEADLEPAMERVNARKGQTYKCRVTEAGGFNNIYFNSIVDEGEDGGGDSGGGEEAGGGGEAGSIDGMDLDQLLELCDGKDLWDAMGTSRRKARKMDIDDLRDLVEKNLPEDEGGDAGGGEEMPDLDKLDLDGLLDLCDEKDLWGAMDTTRRKARKMDEDDLRDLIEKQWQPTDGGSAGGGDDDKGGDGKGGDDELADAIRNLLVAYGIDCKDGDDLKTLKKRAEGYKFPKKELEKHELAALKKAGMEDKIKG